MSRRAGFARRDVVVLVVVVLLVAAVGAVVLPAIARAREEARRISCRNNLNQMAKGMATYLNEHGSNRFYPWPLGRGRRPDDFDGGEWLASLYWTDALLDPSVYICPSTEDTNHNGYDLGTHKAIRGRFDWDTVSYAGLHYRSFTALDGSPRAIAVDGRPRAIADDFPPNLPMAAHDTQGPRPYPAHGGGSGVLFLDSHVEFRTRTELDLDGWSQGRLPWPLRN